MITPYILNREFETVRMLDDYISFIWTDRFNKCGDFEIILPYDPNLFDYLKQNWYVVNPESEHTMIIESIYVKSEADGEDTVKISGRSLESILDRRITWGLEYHNKTVQDCIIDTITSNCIKSSASARNIKGLSTAWNYDEKLKSMKIETQFTGDNIYELTTNLCSKYGIGFKLTMPTDGNFIFKLLTNEDRSYSQTKNPVVIFSPTFENLLNANSYESNQDYKTVALVGGEGEGNDRWYKSNDWTGDTGLDRRELFVDARDLRTKVRDPGSKTERTLSSSEYYSTLNTRGDRELAKHQVTTIFDGELESTRSQFKYKQDYNIGDIVQVEDKYRRMFTAMITEYIYSYTDSAIKCYPTFEVINKEVK